ncbi:unnamed protein product [Effrenium voratum]|nr:unnamed protein product [Effrenium voratum]
MQANAHSFRGSKATWQHRLEAGGLSLTWVEGEASWEVSVKGAAWLNTECGWLPLGLWPVLKDVCRGGSFQAEVVVVVTLPGLAPSEAALEVSETELRVTSLRPELPHRVSVALPVPVETEAKWSKRSQQLTVKLALMHPLNWLDYGLCALALDPRLFVFTAIAESEVQIDGECGLEADVSFLQLQLKEEVDLMAHCWNISADLYSPAKDLHHCEAPQSVSSALNRQNIENLYSEETCLSDFSKGHFEESAVMVRRPRDHVLSQYKHCANGGGPRYHAIVHAMHALPGEPNCKLPDTFQAWVAYWHSHFRDSGPSSAYRHPFKCYIPWNRQSWQLTCSDRFLMNPVDEDSSIKAMQSATLLGVVEAMHESVCLFSARLKGSLPAHCSCESSDWSSFVEYHEDHGSQYEAAIEDFDETVLQQVDDLTKVDRPMYQAAVKRFIGDLGQVERKFGTKILCHWQRFRKRAQILCVSKAGASTSEGLFIVLLVLMLDLWPVHSKVIKLVKDYSLQLLPCIVYAFGRWQWFLNGTSSTLKESPSCDDKVEYYRSLRNTYLTFLLMFSSAMAIWVAHLKAAKRED